MSLLYSWRNILHFSSLFFLKQNNKIKTSIHGRVLDSATSRLTATDLPLFPPVFFFLFICATLKIHSFQLKRIIWAKKKLVGLSFPPKMAPASHGCPSQILQDFVCFFALSRVGSPVCREKVGWATQNWMPGWGRRVGGLTTYRQGR